MRHLKPLSVEHIAEKGFPNSIILSLSGLAKEIYGQSQNKDAIVAYGTAVTIIGLLAGIGSVIYINRKINNQQNSQ